MLGLHVDFAGRPSDVAMLQAQGGPADVSTYAHSGQIALAWYLRQADTATSETIAASLTSQGQWLTELDSADIARLHLVKAECQRLRANLEPAASYLALATDGFAAIDDRIGLGDCAFLRAELHLLNVELDAAMHALAEAVTYYENGGDEVRLLIAQARLAFQESYADASMAAARWHGRFDMLHNAVPPLPAAYICAFRGHVAFQLGDFPLAILHLQQGVEQAEAAGFPLLSCALATITGAAYANLFDLPTALEWKERAYALAKSSGWPEALGMALASMAETTTSLGQFDRAQALFEAALPNLARLPETRRHSIAYNAYGHLFLAMARPQEALTWFERALLISNRLAHPDLERALASAISKTLVRLGRLAEAEAAILRFIGQDGGSRNNPYYEIEALRALAAVRRAQDNGDPSRAIAVLEQAVATGANLDGLTIRDDIYTELARDYEAAGQFQKALAYERRARDSWQRNFDKQNGARILAMQVRFDTARAKAEAEHHRKLAEAEAARAAELDRANQTLERLGVIGQEITARLDSEAVFTMLSRHIHDLMHVSTLFVGLKDDANQVIDIRYRMEDGNRLPPRQVPLASDNLSARCVRDNDEILVAWGERSNPNSVPGTRHMRTVLFRPLALGDRVLGVVSVQSDKPDAYGPRELLIFRTICAYGAIAMANAEAYQQLDRAMGETREALKRLVQQEKMAALGQLVAGVAHEVNTPLGVTLSAVSQLNDTIRLLRGQVDKGVLTRSALTEALDNGQELAALAQRNVTRAADMIRTFKGVAVDHGSDERRVFELGDYLSEIMSLIRARVAGNGNKIEIDVAPVQMDTYPGALAQVITNLVSNIADHAYAPERPGRIILRGRPLDAYMVEIAVVDQGIGIPADILPKVFDPFFTTRRAAGSMGLGLHVAFNQVTQRLNGSISIDSVPGQGTVATLRIPREGPVHAPASFLPPAV